ncbi:hypothetical protein [Altererythrobacter aquiaggeris]|uniref:hypothetical protein n=1 Tax=Aestuarierythrobacter aquiaggeris TaxID=1898396 RepID=UPI00301742D9
MRITLITAATAAAAAAAAAATAALALGGCGPQTPEGVRAASVAKCERQFGRMTTDPALGNALCYCMADRLTEEELEITDMLGDGRAQVEEITRSCARQTGVPLPQ